MSKEILGLIIIVTITAISELVELSLTGEVETPAGYLMLIGMLITLIHCKVFDKDWGGGE